ncbi:caspase domain-containing protein [Streptomyces monticola]|uniref:Caspase domain-containing protein n=1 Tax=Streptomyces monticola TaxID=2666263 RepID=A0ABW2JVW6_9ACTN
MGRYRALLIGASDYEMRGVKSLAFIPGDLERLGAVLRGHGFDDVQVLAGREGGKQVSANFVNARVIGMLRRARRGDTVLILLSGHGVHARGQDYLVPEDIDEDVHPFESGCVPIDWRRHLDETPADHVVFLIDACREGIDQDSMGVSGVKEWGHQKISAALRRKVAYLYGCSPAQLSLFVRDHERVVDGRDHGTAPGESFSIFSRSVSDVVAARPKGSGLSLDAFMDAVQDRVTELHRAYGKKGQPQLVRVVTDIPVQGFHFLPGAGSDARPIAGPVVPDEAAMGVTGPARFRFRRPKVSWKLLVSWALASVVIAAGLGGYAWTQGRYFVAAKDGHVALYQGIDQKFLGIDLAHVERDYPDIDLNKLPTYQQNQVMGGIAVGSRAQALDRINALGDQVEVCRIVGDQGPEATSARRKLTEEQKRLAANCARKG